MPRLSWRGRSRHPPFQKVLAPNLRLLAHVEFVRSHSPAIGTTVHMYSPPLQRQTAASGEGSINGSSGKRRPRSPHCILFGLSYLCQCLSKANRYGPCLFLSGKEEMRKVPCALFYLDVRSTSWYHLPSVGQSPFCFSLFPHTTKSITHFLLSLTTLN